MKFLEILINNSSDYKLYKDKVFKVQMAILNLLCWYVHKSDEKLIF